MTSRPSRTLPGLLDVLSWLLISNVVKGTIIALNFDQWQFFVRASLPLHFTELGLQSQMFKLLSSIRVCTINWLDYGSHSWSKTIKRYRKKAASLFKDNAVFRAEKTHRKFQNLGRPRRLPDL